MDPVNNESGGPPKSEQTDSTLKLQDKVNAAKEITMLFRMERYAYLACSALAVALLFYCAMRLLQNGEKVDPVVIGSFFGSGGLFTFSTGRLIFMWTKIVDIIFVGVK